MRRELTNTIAPTNLTASLSYDAVGNLQSSKDARGNIVSNTWSATRKLLATTLPATPQGAPIITNGYDNRDWLSRTFNNLPSIINYTNDAAQRVIGITDPLQRTTRFGYDGDNRLIATTNAANEVTRQYWNARSELTQVTDPANRIVKRKYDEAGNQTLLTNRNGKVWQFQFDAANRLTNTISPIGRTASQTYNNRGLLASIKQPSGNTATLNYDAKGRLTNRVDGVGSTTYRYDANNNLTNLFGVPPSGGPATNTWTYDAYNRVSSYRDADGNLIQYHYDANGNVTNLVYPGGKTVAYAYDSLNRLTNVTDWAGRKTLMTYDLASRLTSITRPNGTQRIINYDAAGETTNIVEKLTNNAPIAFFKLNWNSAARVEWEFAAPLPHSNSVPTRTMTYDDDNRLLTVNGQSVANDLDGNLTSGPLTNSTFVTYTYDARNRLLAVGGLNYGYDPAGNRTAVTNGTNVVRFVINPNARLSQVLMRIKIGVTNYYIYGAGLLYEVTEAVTSTNTLTYHYDYRGSTVAITDGNGIPTDQIEYSAYGSITYRTNYFGPPTDTPFLFNGGYGVQTDPNGLLFMRARYYNPYICRFLNPDPASFAGGLNFYAYADGNPISYLDPFGLGATEGGVLPSWVTYNNIAAMVVPGQAAWNNAVSSFQAGNYGSAALSAVQMVGEQILFVFTLGTSSSTTPALRTTEVMASQFENTAAERGLAGSIRNVNPTGGGMNCVNCAIAGDATLAGNAASALPGGATSIGVLERTFGGTFQPVSGQMQIGSILSQSGTGARGIVYGQSLIPGRPGHVFNAINQGGTIRFLDAQAGGLGVNNFNNFQNFRFLPTNP